MKLGEYTSLNRPDLLLDFNAYITALELPYMEYVAIGVQDTIHKVSTSIMSNQTWQKTFKELNLAADDPIRKAAFGSRVSHFSFDEVDHQNSAGQEAMRQRKKHGIENGIVFMRRNLTHNFMLTLGTGFKGFNNYRYLIDYYTNINLMFDDLIKLVTPSTKNYRIIIPTCRAFCAK